MSLDRGWLIIEGRQQGCGDLWVDKTALCPLRIETFLRAFRYTTFMHARTFFFCSHYSFSLYYYVFFFRHSPSPRIHPLKRERIHWEHPRDNAVCSYVYVKHQGCAAPNWTRTKGTGYTPPPLVIDLSSWSHIISSYCGALSDSPLLGEENMALQKEHQFFFVYWLFHIPFSFI